MDNPARNSTALVVSGEKSGDLLGSSIVKALKKNNRSLNFWGCGGELMRSSGVEILYTHEELAVIGFLEAIIHYPRLKRYFNAIVARCRIEKPDVAILVDYPGFNLRLAEKLKGLGIPVVQVVSPQIWAWHYSRVETIRKNVDAVLCLFQFETEIYKKENIRSFFIGHPLAKQVKEKIKRLSKLKRDKNKIALLPGSRYSEVRNNIPFMLETAVLYKSKNPESIFEIAAASLRASTWIEEYIARWKKEFPDKGEILNYISIEKNEPSKTMLTSWSALACSGTVTMECALHQIPFVLIYKTSALTYAIGKRVIKLPYIGIVNIILQKEATKEFIQSEMQPHPVTTELDRISHDINYRKKQIAELKKIESFTYKKDPAAEAASVIESLIKPVKDKKEKIANKPLKKRTSKQSAIKKNNSEKKKNSSPTKPAKNKK